MSSTITKSAMDYHNEGYNCAESIFLAFRERVAPDLNPDVVRMATPFGSGIGGAGCACGALTGAVMILGILKGRVTPDVPRKEPYALANEFHNSFKSRFGATCCRVLKKNQSGAGIKGATCAEIISGTEELLLQLLDEKKPVQAVSDC